MKSDAIRTIFSIYQIWLAEEQERSAAELREAAQTGNQRIEEPRRGGAMGRTCEFEGFRPEGEPYLLRAVS